MLHTLLSGSFPTVNGLFRACYKSSPGPSTAVASPLRTLWGVQTVSWGRRLIALIIDWAVALFSAAALTGAAWAGPDAANPFVTLGIFVVEVALLTGLLGYSIGKRLAGLRVENSHGRPIGLLRALLRTALLALVIPAVVINDGGRGLHDVAAGSRIVRVTQ